MATLTELYNARTGSDLRNRVEVAADMWVLTQAGRETSEGIDGAALVKCRALAYDAMVDPVGVSARLMRIVPLAAEISKIPLDSDDALSALVSTLLDKYALTRPTTTPE